MKQLSLPALTGPAHGVSDTVAGFLVVQVLLLNSLPTVTIPLTWTWLIINQTLALAPFRLQSR